MLAEIMLESNGNSIFRDLCIVIDNHKSDSTIQPHNDRDERKGMHKSLKIDRCIILGDSILSLQIITESTKYRQFSF